MEPGDSDPWAVLNGENGGWHREPRLVGGIEDPMEFMKLWVGVLRRVCFFLFKLCEHGSHIFRRLRQ